MLVSVTCYLFSLRGSWLLGVLGAAFSISSAQCLPEQHFSRGSGSDEVGLPAPGNECVDFSGTCRLPSSWSQGRTYREPSAAFCTFALEPLSLGPKSSTGGLRGQGAQCGEEGGLLRPCSWCSLVGTRVPDVPASLGTRMCSSRCRRGWQPLAGGALRSRSRVGWADTASYPELYLCLW